MMNNKCLNCEKELIDKYCSGCGQKADTHRITFKKFIFQDLIHGTFHFEKGMFFTAKQALLHPGKAALEYISGKRVRYYNVFYLILITIGLIIFFRHFYENFYIGQDDEVLQNQVELNESSKAINEIFDQKSKLIISLFVPFAALNSFILFKKKKLNFSEHCIIAGMILLGMLLISVFGNLFFFLDLIIPFSDKFATVISWIVTVLVIFHIIYGYYNAFGPDYSKSRIASRIFLFFALFCSELMILFLVVWGFISNWKFGSIHVSPFG
jgi:hypothetical protein